MAVNNQSERFWSLMKFLQDEIVFISGLAIAWLFIATASIIEYWGILGSLLVMILVTLYYSVTFFRDDTSWRKLYFYIAMLPFLIGYFALMFKSFGVVTPDSNRASEQLDWLNALYFSVVTWTTLGYGDFRPDDVVTKCFVMAEALLGYIYMGVFVGKILILSQKNK
ncbi:MAG: two pore domain potassium channel family protein [Piscirickettsiaceae bacterium]|nr:two pore domain potassium channel family protein [Piscirickettsiaceae bacterium]